MHTKIYSTQVHGPSQVNGSVLRGTLPGGPLDGGLEPVPAHAEAVDRFGHGDVGRAAVHAEELAMLALGILGQPAVIDASHLLGHAFFLA